MNGRTLVFILGAKLGFDIAKIKAKLLELAVAQWDIVLDSGGKTLASASVGGESYTFNIPTGFDPAGFAELLRLTYKDIKDMTNEEVEAYAFRTEPDGKVLDFRCLAGV